MANSEAPDTVDLFIQSLPESRRLYFGELREMIRNHLPPGFQEGMDGSGLVSYTVPHSLYPEGYHVRPELPLPFISLASRKGYIAVYHMGLYAIPGLLSWFRGEYPKHVATKPDMGKCCIRFRKVDCIPLKLIAGLAERVSAEQWIAAYREQVKR